MGSGIYQGLGMGLLGAAQMQQNYASDKRRQEYEQGLLSQKAGMDQEAEQARFANEQQLVELRTQKQMEIEELTNKYATEKQERAIKSEEGMAAANRASSEKIAGMRVDAKTSQTEEDTLDIRKKQDEAAARVMGEKTFSLGVPLKNKPTPAQLKELEKIYGSAVTVEKDGRGLFKAAVYNVSEDTSGTSPAPEPEPKPENGGDPPFTGKKQIVTLDNGEKVEAKEISGGRWLASINGKWQIIEGVGGEKESTPEIGVVSPSKGLLTRAQEQQAWFDEEKEKKRAADAERKEKWEKEEKEKKEREKRYEEYKLKEKERAKKIAAAKKEREERSRARAGK